MSLVFVDYGTKSATRKMLASIKKRIKESGLPSGWHTVNDHKCNDFFFQTKEKMIIGTYAPSAMPKRDLRRRSLLQKQPAEGAKPKISRVGQDLTGRAKSYRSTTAPAALFIDATSLVTYPPDIACTPLPPADKYPMPTEEKVKYFSRFEQAPNAERWAITLEKALEQTKSLDLPTDIMEVVWERSDMHHD